MRLAKRKIILIIFLFYILASFLTLPRNPLQNDDASAYALMAKNAVIQHQWLAQFITPGDLTSFLDKPPLGIWLIAAPLKLIGVNELTVHIPNIIYFCVLLGFMYWGVSRLVSKKLAFYSLIIAATSLGLVFFSRTPKLEILISFFILSAHLAIFAYLKKDRPICLYLFSLALAGGFLVKSGFGLMFPGLTCITLLLFHPRARQKLLKALFSVHAILSFFLFTILVGSVLGLQSLALKEQWLPYLKSITIQSKYNGGYLGLGLNVSTIGFLLIILFPWSALYLSALKLKINLSRRLNLNTFCHYWLWSSSAFLFFCYRQNDLRTFVMLCPPLAILAAIKLIAIGQKAKRPVVPFVWNIFFLLIFSIILCLVIANPVNPQGLDLRAAILPLALFVLFLGGFSYYLFKPSNGKFVFSFLLACLAYSTLFYNTLPLAHAFNSDVNWPALIQQERALGHKFYIYRPPDRRLFYSPDLLYIDFMAGPADQYFWYGKALIKAVNQDPTIIASDTVSWQKLGLDRAKLLVQDDYSGIWKTN